MKIVKTTVVIKRKEYNRTKIANDISNEFIAVCDDRYFIPVLKSIRNLFIILKVKTSVYKTKNILYVDLNSYLIK